MWSKNTTNTTNTRKKDINSLGETDKTCKKNKLNAFSRHKQGQYSSPVGDGAKEDEDVPNGMIVRAVVVDEEVCPCGIGYAFGQQQ